MTPHGNAENTQCSHANFERVFNLFLACAASISDPLLRAKAGKTFDDMPAEVACNQAIYNFYATRVPRLHVHHPDGQRQRRQQPRPHDRQVLLVGHHQQGQRQVERAWSVRRSFAGARAR